MFRHMAYSKSNENYLPQNFIKFYLVFESEDETTKNIEFEDGVIDLGFCKLINTLNNWNKNIRVTRESDNCIKLQKLDKKTSSSHNKNPHFERSQYKRSQYKNMSH